MGSQNFEHTQSQEKKGFFPTHAKLLIKIALVALLVVSFVIDFIELVLRLQELEEINGVRLAFSCAQLVIYLAFLAEEIYRYLGIKKDYGDNVFRRFLENYQAGSLYIVLCPIALILSFAVGTSHAWVLVVLWAIDFVKCSDVIGYCKQKQLLELRKKKTIYTKQENIIRFSVLAVFLVAFILDVIKLVFNKFSAGALIAMDAIQVVCYVLFTVEFAFRLRGYYKQYGKGFFKEYWKFNKAEPIYTVLAPIVFVCVFALGGNNNFWELALWILLFLKQPNVTKRFNDDLVFNIIAKTIMVLLICVFTIPLLNLIAMAFSSSASILGGEIVSLFPKKFTLYPMRYVLTYRSFWRALGVSVGVTVLGTIGSVFLMTLCAYPLSKQGMPFKKVVLVYFLICMLFSGGMAPKILLMDALGLKETFWALVLPSLINVFNLLLIKGFLEGLPAELEESAKLDGANNYQILFQIFVPLSLPMMVTVAMFTAISYWNNYYNALLYLTESQKYYPIPMFIKNFFALSAKDLAYSDPTAGDFLENIKMALILASIIPIAFVYPFTLKYLTKGVTVGSVKG